MYSLDKWKIMKATKFIRNIVYVIFPFVTNGRKQNLETMAGSWAAVGNLFIPNWTKNDGNLINEDYFYI